MKKILLISIIIFFSLNLKAQTTPWITQGATWFYTWWDPGGLEGNDKIEYSNDTSILGKTCEVLKTTRYSYGQPGPNAPITLISTKILPNRYTYNNGDTVFYLNNNKFNVLYNFDAQPNDKWDLGVDSSSFYCTKSILIVDSISTMLIGSNSHRVLYTSDSTNSSVAVLGKVIEHIGSLNYLFPTARNCNTQIVVDFLRYSFSCFQDNSMNYMLVTSAECENPYHVGLLEETKKSNQIHCFPNPVEDKLNINFSNDNYYRISIYNALGEKVIDTQNQKIQSLTIDLRNINSGIYIASFENKSGERINKRIIKK